LLGALGGGALGFGLVVALRAVAGLEIFQTEPTGYPHVIVPAITTPLGFIAGIGCFDYWLRWALGAPTAAEDHSDHGASGWRDYLRFNTDHKVIGIQYIVTTFVFFFIGGLLAMGIRAELAQPGTQIVDPQTFNGLFSTHAAIMIFLFVIPVFAGIANYVLPLMIGAPDMAFPRLNALSFWLLPFAGILFLASFLVSSSRAGRSTPAGPATPRSRPAPRWASRSSTSGCSSRASRRSSRLSTSWSRSCRCGRRG
jgi:cytochrome c oxidase subunit 1